MIFKLMPVAFLFFSFTANATDFFMFTSTSKTQVEAQQKAAETGGWVLVSNFYKKLTPGMYAVVRGPYKSQKAADTELQSLKKVKGYQNAYVKDAGEIDLNNGVSELGPQVVAALLGEIQISQRHLGGGENPCEPEGRYTDFSLSYYTVDRKLDKTGDLKFKPRNVKLDIGGLTRLSSGEIERMRVCAE